MKNLYAGLAVVMTLSSMMLSSCASAGPADLAKQNKLVIVPSALQETYDQLQFAPAVRAGDFIYLSGVVASLETGETAADMSPAFNRAFDQIEMVLREAGTDWSHAVDVTSYLTDLDTQLGQMWAVKGERVPAPYPAWTAIGVDRLFGGDAALAEIKVTVYHPLP